MTPERYLELQFKKDIRHGHVHNAELKPVPSEPVFAKLKGNESCVVLVRNKWQQCLWFTDSRLLRQDASVVIELFPYSCVRAVHWMSRKHPFSMSKTEHFDRLEVDLEDGGVEIDGLDQAYLPVFQFLGFVASRRTASE